ncbi:MFS transporter [Nitrospirillum sp. BR 11163]|uniref:MFS transporter n=1 Tax=Nitrospirillum sp. BR 11163 TaxID=3104323 RepID=UPI002AFE17CD|nr:MFS transporter [Nitrospirillum sp. BR 11163]MEA1672723.1 MFS transporter [Nitrospirillum sp. BR 11163]
MASGADRTSYPPDAQAWWGVAVFSLAAIVSYTDRLILNQLVDPIRRDLRITDLQVSYLQGPAFALLYVFAGLVLGRLADRGNRRNLVLAGVATWSLGTIACAFSPTFWGLFAARLCVGIGEAALAPAVISLIADSVPPARRATAMGTFLMSCVIGTGAAITIGGVLLSAAEGGWFASLPVLGALSSWRLVLLLAGLPGILILALVATIREPARQGAAGKGSLRAGARHFLADRARLGPLYLGMGIVSIGDFAMFAWVPTLLSRRYGLGSAEIGGMMGTIVAVTGVIGSIATGVASDWAERRGGLPARLALAMAGAACTLPGVLLLLPGTAPLAVTGFTIWMLGTTIIGIAGVAALQELLPNELRGVGMSLTSFFNMALGLGLGPSLVALVTEHVYGDAAAVGWAIVTVALPAAVAGLALFTRARAAARR